jgi:ubiquinone/menaquinone biosynthesis C-methylase UbiE
MREQEDFFINKIRKIFEEKKLVIDIGGGLRAKSDIGNRYDPNRSWLKPYLEKVDYKILDPVPDFKPDIVGDIHNLPFTDNSVDAIICIAVLEHVENPIKATSEIYRVLKPGGYAYIYMPFLFYYHAEVGYYKDYWRFTGDAIDLLFREFSTVEKNSVRGAISTWIKLSPFGRSRLIMRLAKILDRLTGKNKTRQVSGYNVFLIK